MGRIAGLSRFRQVLLALLMSVLVLAIGATSLFLIHLRETHLTAAEVHTAEYARLLEEFIERTFRSAEFIADHAVQLAKRQPLPELAQSQAAWNDLRALTLGLPETGTLWIVDRDGMLVLGSTGFPSPVRSLSDRYYFSAHLERRRHLVVGPLVQTKARGTQAFHLSKRIEDDSGNLIGVAVVGIDAEPFTNFHRTLGHGGNSSLAVVDGQGRVIMRQPHPELGVERSLAGGPIMLGLQKKPDGIVRGISMLDGVARISAYRMVEPYGVAVVASVAIEDALQPWWTNLWAMLGALSGIGLVLGALAAFAFRSLSREEAMMAGLEAAIRDRTQEATRNAEEARAANLSKSRFLAAASHDLRQPLQAAGMFLEALSVRLNDTPHAPIIGKLRQSLDSTQALLTMLLDISTLEAGRIKPSPTTFPLAPLLASLVDQMEPEAAERNLRLRVASTSAWIYSDPTLLERILRNLLVNALRYTEKGGVLIGCRRRGHTLAIQVIDSGTGIAPESMDAIFEEFTRLQDRNDGLGLGLSVVRRTARLLGHEVEVKSQQGKGSCFTIFVPLVKVAGRKDES